jgi:hypothetical protein
MKHLLKLILLGTLIINFNYNGGPKPFTSTMYDITPPIPPGGGYYQESNEGGFIEYEIAGDKDYQLEININKKIEMRDAIHTLQILSGIKESN